MKINITPKTQVKAHNLAKEVYQDMVEGFTFDGRSLKPAPAVTLDDTIISGIASPNELLRLKLVYGDDGPDDHWRASAESMLGGGIIHRDKQYWIVGASSSLKKGHIWLASDTLQQRLHRYFCTAQQALSYLGILFSGCHHGIHRLDELHGRVVQDGDEGTADGMGFISPTLLDKLGLPHRQIQVRLVGEDWLGKGTLLPTELPGKTEVLLPESMIKGSGKPPNNKPWSVWFGVRDVARTRSYSSSFTFSQWFPQETMSALYPVVDTKLEILSGATSTREGALRFLGLKNSDDELNEAKTKVEAFLQAGVSPQHPWLRRHLQRLTRAEYVKLALGCGFRLQGHMGAFADLADGAICCKEIPAGMTLLSRYPVRDPQSLQAVWNEPDAIKDALPGTIYIGKELTTVLDGDYDGDYYVTCSQDPAVDAVMSKDWYPDYKREDEPPKYRLNDSLDLLPYVAVQSIGNRVGSLTYAIAGAVHDGKIDKVATLSAGLQSEVMSLKWDTRANREILNGNSPEVPEFISNAKQDKNLFVHHAEKVDSNTPLSKNYNLVVTAWQKEAGSIRGLIEFKPLIPVWMETGALDKVEETAAMVQLYNRWIASILHKNPEPTQDELQGPLSFLRKWEASKEDDRNAWAVAIWHVVHGSRVERSTGSAAFHAFSQELIDIISSREGRRQIKLPESHKEPLSDSSGLIGVIPLVGAVRASKSSEITLNEILKDSPKQLDVTTKQNGSVNAAFFSGDCYLGQVAKDHLLYGSIPGGLKFNARIQRRGRTLYMVPQEDWLMSLEGC
ncbi:MAG: hypothetical protein HQ568_09160 [Calditrichaeota bacterium]|nr:hypothetical protein [Calditrichota bacterium]